MQPSLPIEKEHESGKSKLNYFTNSLAIATQHAGATPIDLEGILLLKHGPKSLSGHLAANPRVSVAFADAILPLILHEVCVGHVFRGPGSVCLSSWVVSNIYAPIKHLLRHEEEA